MECWTIGSNKYGNQMIGRAGKSIKILTKINLLSRNAMIADIASGYEGSIYILTQRGRLIVAGCNTRGEMCLYDLKMWSLIDHWIRESHAYFPAEIILLITNYTPKDIIMTDQLTHTSTPIIVQYPKEIKLISRGVCAKHKFVVDEQNRVYGVGYNKHYQLGFKNDIQNKCSFVPILLPKNIKIKQIECAGLYSIFLSYKGNVYSCGTSEVGAIGFGGMTNVSKTIRKLRKPKSKIKQISCGSKHTVLLNVNGTAYAFGSNYNGQCGFGGSGEIADCQSITYFHKKIVQICCGKSHTLFLDEEGIVYATGSIHMLGRGYDDDRQIDGDDYTCNPERIVSLKNNRIIDIKAGYTHNIAKTYSNEYFLWGSNKNNECLVYDNKTHTKLPTQFTDPKKHISDMYPGFRQTVVCFSAKIQNV